MRLAVLIFLAQLPQLTNVPPTVYVLTTLSLAIIYILPRFTKAVPSPLVALAVMTIAAIALKLGRSHCRGYGTITHALPSFALPQVPFTVETFKIILPYSLTLAIVGLLASFLTASLVDELTDTPSDKNQEAKGQGIANIVTAFFGGMAGCGMIGQSVINVQSGGRGRLSTLCGWDFPIICHLVFARLGQANANGSISSRHDHGVNWYISLVIFQKSSPHSPHRNRRHVDDDVCHDFHT